MILRAPYPWFGGKRRIASLFWERVGDVPNYIEPFYGSGAVLLGRPHAPRVETVNDLDAYICNFVRAVQQDPDAVAYYADSPVNETDLHARHQWLVTAGKKLVDRLLEDPEYFDAKVAGWWVWGLCLWIGSGWCAEPGWRGRGNAGRRSRGINAGAIVESAGPVDWMPRPDLSAPNGRGEALKVSQKRPSLTGNGQGVGVHSLGVARKIPIMSANHGQGVGVHGDVDADATGTWKKRPVIGRGARGVASRAVESNDDGDLDALTAPRQIDDLAGNDGAAGKGIHACGFDSRTGGLYAYMRALSERLRRVRVCCGDFGRVLTKAVTVCVGTPTGVLLDPPYPAPNEDRAACYRHDDGEVWWKAREWALAHGDNPGFRIALCGYEHPDATMPENWSCVAWKASGGYGRSERGRANALRERIWFSPHCIVPEHEQASLFTEVG
ncbi:MAG TPA: DNA adenine methylase [Candidatus Limnocylindria bacterium]|nr:DNA adenine methylase [Candidatus Limnocylindria bacterium]